MRETIEQYQQNIAKAKQLAEGDTLYFGKLNADEQNVLTQYYFAFRDPVAVQIMNAYRERQAVADLDIEERALRALGRLRQAAHDY
jgi:hypothetical protein